MSGRRVLEPLFGQMVTSVGSMRVRLEGGETGYRVHNIDVQPDIDAGLYTFEIAACG